MTDVIIKIDSLPLDNKKIIIYNDVSNNFISDYIFKVDKNYISEQKIKNIYSDSYKNGIKGYGKISGFTYEKNETQVIESEIKVRYQDKVKVTTTVNGAFTINQLDESKTYDVYARPLNGTYETKIATNVEPIHDVKSYDMSIYTSMPSILYKNLENKIFIYVYENVGNVTYTLENSPIGVSIQDNVIIIKSNSDSLLFSVIVTDSIGQTRTIPINVNLSNTQIVKLPLEKDIIDVNGNSSWQHYGTNDFINGWMRTSGNNHIYSNDIKKFEKDFSVSMNVVMWDMTKKEKAFNVIFSSGETSSTFQSIFLCVNDTYNLSSQNLAGYLRFYDGIDNIEINSANNKLNEYRNYYIKIYMKNNIEYLQINDFIFSNKLLSITNFSDFVLPLRIGANLWDENNSKGLRGRFNGLIKNFTFSNGYVYDEKPQFDNNTIYEIDFKNNLTNYYEPVIKNLITDVSDGYKLNGVSSYIQLNGNTVNQLKLTSNQTLTIEFTPLNETFVILDETISKGGFEIKFESSVLKYTKSDGTIYNTNLKLNLNVKNTLKIQKENNLLLVDLNNIKLYNQPLFRLSNVPIIYIGVNKNTTKTGFMSGIIHKFRVVDFLE